MKNKQINNTDKLSNSYLSWLDAAKGLGIICVVVGHAMFPMHLIIDGFHMALFFVLAGVTLSVKKSFMEYSRKKFFRIMVPYFFWGAIWLLTGIPNIPIWFLITLFSSLLFLYPLVKYLPLWVGSFIMLCISVLLCGKHSLLSELNIYVSRPLVAATFICIGFLVTALFKNTPSYLCRIREWILKIISHRMYLFISFMFCSVFYLIILLGGEKMGCYTDISFAKMTLFRINWFLTALIPLSGTLATILCSIFLQNVKKLRWLGKNSLVIMCVHFPIAEKLNTVVANMPYSDNLYFKVGYGLVEWGILFIYCALMVFICNRFIPTLTGGIKTYRL